ncbi:hypothetical protein, partial [Tritonibacter mobilis]|uniref:hypothetical protein n=1 Tax=Tritonibacter mobilis TaxID=379347 RepID=UPI00197CE00F
IPPLATRIESATYASIKHEFFNKIGRFVSAPGVKLRLAGMPLGLPPASCSHQPKPLLWSWPT